jgi:signal transduction histidine kinase
VVGEAENDDAEKTATWDWWEMAGGSQLSFLSRIGVLLAGVLSLVYLVAALLSTDTFPKNFEAQLDYKQLLGPVLVIAINTIALANSRRHPIIFYTVSVVSMIVLAFVLGDRASAATPLYWIAIFVLSIFTEGRSFFLTIFFGLSADIIVSTYLRSNYLDSVSSFATFASLAIEPAVNVVMSYGLIITLGKVVRNQRRHKLVDGARIQRLKQERDTAVEVAVADERTRMARELHDVSAHHLTAVIIQGKAASEIFESTPGEVPDLLFGVIDQGERALRSLRQLVGVLRIGPTESQDPQPSIRAVMSLVEGCRHSGLTVTAEIDGDLSGIDSAIQVSCYRIVQESLSNALRHAHGSRVSVSIKRDEGDLVIQVENSAGESLERTLSGQGLGLVGLRERTESLGGSFAAGHSGEGSWRVQARIPLER